ncbi:polyprenyl synthetase family protein [Streptomyces somaliensis DSM 40738]|uniref:Polyprenyl synthetase family protein n=2 Tax=Streptomyces somaliensis TaxID=78355 RepID=A0AA44DF82_STRE0|nr:polyprenyl synthetase family protein [Streptomyces somaliensis]MCQ0024625.1 polyprenyl synthetase family protein [Streptomyces somaliensis DSM 40738]NKY15871.1 polyprenyl synthetase family protein [Streptomyces somaliensis DSM 40738]
MIAETLTVGSDFFAPRAAIDDLLHEFLTEKADTAPVPRQAALAMLLRDFLDAGKRIRPLLCVAGWRAAGGGEDPGQAVRLAASIELAHACALIHDDIMDGAGSRRGRPTVHRRLADHHHLPSTAEQFGLGGAILVGDLALVWSDELLHTTVMPEAHRVAVLRCVDLARSELIAGQHLDLLTTGDLGVDVETTLTVVRYKTAKYTVERPLQVGAALAGADQRVMDACSAYGVPLGEAFQLRDDVLGVFGDPERTGKSHLDDLREGKCTGLVAHAVRAGSPAQADRLRTLIGDPRLGEREAAEVRGILTETGARAAVERMIEERYQQALTALASAPFPADVVRTLADVAEAAVRRTA